jgi:hypothetical protein
MPWVIAGDVDDKVLWDALVKLGGVDLISTDRPYLYMNEDFYLWLENLESGNGEK